MDHILLLSGEDGLKCFNSSQKGTVHSIKGQLTECMAMGEHF